MANHKRTAQVDVVPCMVHCMAHTECDLKCMLRIRGARPACPGDPFRKEDVSQALCCLTGWVAMGILVVQFQVFVLSQVFELLAAAKQLEKQEAATVAKSPCDNHSQGRSRNTLVKLSPVFGSYRRSIATLLNLYFYLPLLIPALYGFCRGCVAPGGLHPVTYCFQTWESDPALSAVSQGRDPFAEKFAPSPSEPQRQNGQQQQCEGAQSGSSGHKQPSEEGHFGL